PVWEILERIDILSGIGGYGVLLLGLNDGEDLSEPVKGIDLKTGNMIGTGGVSRELIYLQPYSQDLVTIEAWNQDPTSPRYCQPEMYQITTIDPYLSEQGYNTRTVSVHWTRIIHIADSTGNSDIIAIPRLQQVLNRILDIQKI